MVQLTVTAAFRSAVAECQRLQLGKDEAAKERLEFLAKAAVETPIEHQDLVEVSKSLIEYARAQGDQLGRKEWRLDSLLKGATVYQQPAPLKPEPTPEYKALMRSLRAAEEQRHYERMLNSPPAHEPFKQRPTAFDPALSHGQGPSASEADELTFADVNRQVLLIINILVSIIACSVTIWFAARRWDVPQRLGLSMSGSVVVAAAEVAIYIGYIQRIKNAKDVEVKKVETKEIVGTWIIDKDASLTTAAATVDAPETVRLRKGKHR